MGRGSVISRLPHPERELEARVRALENLVGPIALRAAQNIPLSNVAFLDVVQTFVRQQTIAPIGIDAVPLVLRIQGSADGFAIYNPAGILLLVVNVGGAVTAGRYLNLRPDVTLPPYLAIDSGGITDVRTWATQDASGTVAYVSQIPTVDAARIWGTLQKFKDTAFQVGDDASIDHAIILQCAGLTGIRTLTPPDANGKLSCYDLAQLWTAAQDYRVPGYDSLGAAISFTDIVGGGYVAFTSDTGMIGNHLILNRDVGGLMALSGASSDPPATREMGQVNRTAQGAAIASTKLTDTCPAGYYVVHYTLEDTTGDVTAGTIQLSIAYTDDIGATTQSSAALALTAVGRERGSFQCYVASGNLTYNTTLVGIFGTAKYALRVRVLYLG